MILLSFNQIGQGTYSNVYKARDSLTGKIVALKKVRFDNLEPESVKFMAREILILRRLDHPNVIKLEGLVTSRMSCSLYLVFEYMVHDLAGLATNPAIKFTESQVIGVFIFSFKIYDYSKVFYILWLLIELDLIICLYLGILGKMLHASAIFWTGALSQPSCAAS